MGSTAILSAAPMVIARGIRDDSGRQQPAAEINKSSHIALVYTYAQKGPKRRLVNGSEASRIFGTDTFDSRKKYATHATELAKVLLGVGNAVMLERVYPTDIGPRANRALWIDVLPTQVAQYARNPDGSFQYNALGDRVALNDATGNPVKLDGFKVKFVVDEVTDKVDEAKFGTLTLKPGSMTEGSVQSQMYPIAQWWASSPGKVFNESGMRIYAPVDNSLVPVDRLAMVATGCYPYRMAVVKRNSTNETARPVETITGEQYADFTLKSNVINSNTNARYSGPEVYARSYRHINNDGLDYIEGEFEKFHVYDHYAEQLAALFYAKEKDLGSSDSDFKSITFASVVDKKWLFNFFGGQSSNAEPYYTYEIDQSSVRLTESNNLFASGGSDGTMWESALPLAPTPKPYVGSFAHLVATEIAEYANPSSSLLDSAVNIETIFYDSGFPIDTKRELCKFISERKNTFVVLSTFEVNGSKLNATTENSRATALRDYMRMYAESDYFGTQTARGMIVGRHGKLIGSNYHSDLPLTLEIADKAGRMMGAADGKWREGAIFDKAPNNIIKMFEDVNVTYTSASTRNRDWKMGLNWVQSYSPRELFIPGLQTIYDDDTSILNSFFVAMCAVTLQNIGEQVWRDFTGSVRLTDEQLVDAVNAAVNRHVQDRGRFCDMFRIIPRAQITPADKLRGYSWTLVIELYAGVMKTVMTLDVAAKRMSDLEG